MFYSSKKIRKSSLCSEYHNFLSNKINTRTFMEENVGFEKFTKLLY